MLQWTGERFIPGVEGDIVVEHLHRYYAVSELVERLTVLDVACGEGYGSRILASRAATVIGVDISTDAVAHARSRYPLPNLRYEVGSCFALPLEDASVDAIVSFETIEHVREQEQTIAEFARVLRPGGWICVSSPDKLEYSDLPNFQNEYHVRELYADEFRDLLHGQFRNVAMYGQRVSHGSVLAPVGTSDARFFSFRDDGEKPARSAGLLRPVYLIAVASNGICPPLAGGVFEGKEPAYYAELRTLHQQVAQARGELEKLTALHDGQGPDARRRVEIAQMKLYVGGAANGAYSEERTVDTRYVLDDRQVTLRLDVPPHFVDSAAAVRLDLADRVCRLDLESIQVGSDAEVLWEWRPGGAERPWTETSGMVETISPDRRSLRVFCTTGDPNCRMALPPAVLARIPTGAWLAIRLAPAAIAEYATAGLEEFARAMEAAFAETRRSLEQINELQRLRSDLEDVRRERDANAARGNELLARAESASTRATAAEARVRDVLASRSWRATAPLRAIASVGRRIASSPRHGVAAAARWAWQLLPADWPVKRAVKNTVFRSMGPLVSGTGAYQRWVEHQRAIMRIERQFPTNAPGAYDAEHVALPDGSALASARGAALRTLPQLPDVVPVPLIQEPPLVSPRARVIAFYLPQFHPIAENDAWWGKGFTEWTNVTRAAPQFVGHYQPHLPGELGFYDLRLPDVQRRQVELARLYGVGAFCFYFYWFAGRRLLEAPLQQYLQDPSLDLPFCLCWANENWTRRWDGLDAEVLMAQSHSEDDDLAFIAHVAQYMRDPRYLRIGGRPLLLVYRPSLLPEVRATAQRWRDWCRRNGLGEIYLAYTQSFESYDPDDVGFDAAIEFPPNLNTPPPVTERIERINPAYQGTVFDWTAFVERSRHYADKPPTYRLFRGVTPSWDNEARRPGRGSVFWGSNPAGYREWLQNAIEDTIARFPDPDERIVFVNAWNEWAEGAHLEPDRRYGYAFLQATRDALAPAHQGAGPRRVLLVSHDAHPHGAQYLALHMARTFAGELATSVEIVLLGDGPLREEFSRVGRVHDLADVDPESPAAAALAARLHASGLRAAVCNTTVSGRFLGTLKRAGFRCLSLVHELPGVIRSHALERDAQCIAASADVVVFPARLVAEQFAKFASLESERIQIRPQGLYKRNRFAAGDDRSEARAELRRRLALLPDAKVVLNVGYADRRKGVDLFVAAGIELMRQDPDVCFVWLGHHDQQLWPSVQTTLQDSGYAERFRFPGREADTDVFYAGADVFALSSREDPFPSVVMEALDAGLPVVAFDGASGCGDLLAEGCGHLVPAFEVGAFAEAVRRLLADPTGAAAMAEVGTTRIRRDYSFRHYLFDLALWLHLPLTRVSAVVPNYNYARYIEERLRSIDQQSYPLYELIVLDDASTDDSVRRISRLAAELRTDTQVVVNATNSGSVFAQWRRGAAMARGDLVWLAEADDVAEPGFLATAVAPFADSRVVLSYTESRQVGPDGEALCDHYRDYVSDISEDKWHRPYCLAGDEEIRQALAVKNTIPNVSAAVFDRRTLLAAMAQVGGELDTFKVAGDWRLYVEILRRGWLAFHPTPLNRHRRHPASVTLARFDLSQLEEIVRMQRLVQASFAVPEAVKRQANRYAQRLYREFGLATAEAPEFTHHPLLRLPPGPGSLTRRIGASP